MGQKGLARAALATTLAVAFAACPSTAQTVYNDTVVQFSAAEVKLQQLNMGQLATLGPALPLHNCHRHLQWPSACSCLCYTAKALTQRQTCVHPATVCLSMPFAVQANGPANPSCGFGPLSLSSFPFGKAASINANSPFLDGLPQGGCGLCFQLTCEAGVSIPT